jgi:hypothetical protein
MTNTADDVILRIAEARDRDALRRLAQRDSADVPVAPQLVAEVGGELVAAVSLADGGRIADPLRPTAALLDLLTLRARDLDQNGRPLVDVKVNGCPKATPSIEPLAA